MEAKDTIMTWKETVECSHNPNLELRIMDIREKQAEISFKAGIKEVAEWLERCKKIKVPKYQLKEWGI